jgi:toluene monooxygenase system protein E
VQRRPLKTWSAFGELGRKPSEYEVVTHNLNHTVREPPLELSPDAHGNVWLKKHRDDIALKVADWDRFRDPDQLTYRSYVKVQDENETFVDGMLSEFAALPEQSLSRPFLDLLQTCLTPTRYLAHGLLMMSAYVQQLAPSSYIGNCAAFQTADHLRRIQRVAYRTKQLDLAYPARAFGKTERQTWEEHPQWQPMRRAVERLLVAFDWDDAFVGLNLVVKPLCDELTLRQFAVVAREIGTSVDAFLADNLFLDAQRSQRWSTALCRFLADADGDNRAHLAGLLSKWYPFGDDVVRATSRLLGSSSDSRTAEEIAGATAAAWSAFLCDAGLAVQLDGCVAAVSLRSRTM